MTVCTRCCYARNGGAACNNRLSSSFVRYLRNFCMTFEYGEYFCYNAYEETWFRKDFGALGGVERPKTGYRVDALLQTLEAFFAPARSSHVVIDDAGKLGGIAELQRFCRLWFAYFSCL